MFIVIFYYLKQMFNAYIYGPW